LSAGSEVPFRLEKSTIETILEASDVFAQQSSSLRSSCLDQAKFLKSAAEEYRRWKRRSMKKQQSVEFAPNNGPPIPQHETRSQIVEDVITPDSDITYAASYENGALMGIDFSADNCWETFFNTTGYEFDNWSLLPLTVQL
jgi:hypothetical protein